MTVKHVSQSETSHIRMSSIRDVVTLLEKVSIGASGAATYTSGDSDHADFSCTKNGTGTYDLTYPSGKRAWIDVDLYSPSKTVVGSVITAKSASAGTATIKTLGGSNAAADTEPASGDKLYLRITVER